MTVLASNAPHVLREHERTLIWGWAREHGRSQLRSTLPAGGVDHLLSRAPADRRCARVTTGRGAHCAAPQPTRPRPGRSLHGQRIRHRTPRRRGSSVPVVARRCRSAAGRRVRYRRCATSAAQDPGRRVDGRDLRRLGHRLHDPRVSHDHERMDAERRARRRRLSVDACTLTARPTYSTPITIPVLLFFLPSAASPPRGVEGLNVLRLPDHWVWDSWHAYDGVEHHRFFLRA